MSEQRRFAGRALQNCGAEKALRMLWGTPDAEDAAQEAMIVAWRDWESIRDPAAWTRTVAVRKFLRQKRSPASQTASLDESGQLADPTDLHIFAEQQQHVLRLLRALPSGQRTIAALFYDGMACKEIADVLAMAPTTVRSHVAGRPGCMGEGRLRASFATTCRASPVYSSSSSSAHAASVSAMTF